MEMTIKTLKGATIRLHADVRGNVSADVNGKPHTLTAKIDGNFILLSSNIRAEMNASDAETVAAFFAEAAKVQKMWAAKVAAEYENSAEGFADRMEIRMYGRNSNH